MNDNGLGKGCWVDLANVHECPSPRKAAWPLVRRQSCSLAPAFLQGRLGFPRAHSLLGWARTIYNLTAFSVVGYSSLTTTHRFEFRLCYAGASYAKSQVETGMFSSPSTTSSDTTGCCTSAGDATSYLARKMRTGVGGTDVSSSLGTAKRFRPGKKSEKW